jgi:urease accessory protein
MVSERDIEDSVETCPASLARYLEDWLSESLLIDAVFCREAHMRAIKRAPILELNRQLSAFRLAREMREASLSLGRRFASLAATIESNPLLLELAKVEELHHSVAFGYTFGILQVDSDVTAGAFIHQTVLNTISAAQRLLPLGQTQANRIAWDLKSAIIETVERSRTFSISTVGSFAHLPELASMRHSWLSTRLFIS